MPWSELNEARARVKADGLMGGIEGKMAEEAAIESALANSPKTPMHMTDLYLASSSPNPSAC